jgi:hypothetical protein
VMAASFFDVLALSCANVETAVSQAIRKNKQTRRIEFVPISFVIRGFLGLVSSVRKWTGIYRSR